MSWLLPGHCPCKKTGKDREEQVRTTLTYPKCLFPGDGLARVKSQSGFLRLFQFFQLLLHNIVCILVAWPLFGC